MCGLQLPNTGVPPFTQQQTVSSAFFKRVLKKYIFSLSSASSSCRRLDPFPSVLCSFLYLPQVTCFNHCKRRSLRPGPVLCLSKAIVQLAESTLLKNLVQGKPQRNQGLGHILQSMCSVISQQARLVNNAAFAFVSFRLLLPVLRTKPLNKPARP